MNMNGCDMNGYETSLGYLVSVNCPAQMSRNRDIFRFQ